MTKNSQAGAKGDWVHFVQANGSHARPPALERGLGNNLDETSNKTSLSIVF